MPAALPSLPSDTRDSISSIIRALAASVDADERSGSLLPLRRLASTLTALSLSRVGGGDSALLAAVLRDISSACAPHVRAGARGGSVGAARALRALLDAARLVARALALTAALDGRRVDAFATLFSLDRALGAAGALAPRGAIGPRATAADDILKAAAVCAGWVDERAPAPPSSLVALEFVIVASLHERGTRAGEALASSVGPAGAINLRFAAQSVMSAARHLGGGIAELGERIAATAVDTFARAEDEETGETGAAAGGGGGNMGGNFPSASLWELLGHVSANGGDLRGAIVAFALAGHAALPALMAARLAAGDYAEAVSLGRRTAARLDGAAVATIAEGVGGGADERAAWAAATRPLRAACWVLGAAVGASFCEASGVPFPAQTFVGSPIPTDFPMRFPSSLSLASSTINAAAVDGTLAAHLLGSRTWGPSGEVARATVAALSAKLRPDDWTPALAVSFLLRAGGWVTRTCVEREGGGAPAPVGPRDSESVPTTLSQSTAGAAGGRLLAHTSQSDVLCDDSDGPLGSPVPPDGITVAAIHLAAQVCACSGAAGRMLSMRTTSSRGPRELLIYSTGLEAGGRDPASGSNGVVHPSPFLGWVMGTASAAPHAEARRALTTFFAAETGLPLPASSFAGRAGGSKQIKETAHAALSAALTAAAKSAASRVDSPATATALDAAAALLSQSASVSVHFAALSAASEAASAAASAFSEAFAASGGAAGVSASALKRGGVREPLPSPLPHASTSTLLPPRFAVLAAFVSARPAKLTPPVLSSIRALPPAVAAPSVDPAAPLDSTSLSALLHVTAADYPVLLMLMGGGSDRLYSRRRGLGGGGRTAGGLLTSVSRGVTRAADLAIDRVGVARNSNTEDTVESRVLTAAIHTALKAASALLDVAHATAAYLAAGGSNAARFTGQTTSSYATLWAPIVRLVGCGVSDADMRESFESDGQSSRARALAGALLTSLAVAWEVHVTLAAVSASAALQSALLAAAPPPQSATPYARSVDALSYATAATAAASSARALALSFATSKEARGSTFSSSAASLLAAAASAVPGASARSIRALVTPALTNHRMDESLRVTLEAAVGTASGAPQSMSVRDPGGLVSALLAVGDVAHAGGTPPLTPYARHAPAEDAIVPLRTREILSAFASDRGWAHFVRSASHFLVAGVPHAVNAQQTLVRYVREGALPAAPPAPSVPASVSAHPKKSSPSSGSAPMHVPYSAATCMCFTCKRARAMSAGASPPSTRTSPLPSPPQYDSGRLPSPTGQPTTEMPPQAVTKTVDALIAAEAKAVRAARGTAAGNLPLGAFEVSAEPWHTEEAGGTDAADDVDSDKRLIQSAASLRAPPAPLAVTVCVSRPVPALPFSPDLRPMHTSLALATLVTNLVSESESEEGDSRVGEAAEVSADANDVERNDVLSSVNAAAAIQTSTGITLLLASPDGGEEQRAPVVPFAEQPVIAPLLLLSPVNAADEFGSSGTLRLLAAAGALAMGDSLPPSRNSPSVNAIHTAQAAPIQTPVQPASPQVDVSVPEKMPDASSSSGPETLPPAALRPQLSVTRSSSPLRAPVPLAPTAVSPPTHMTASALLPPPPTTAQLVRGVVSTGDADAVYRTSGVLGALGPTDAARLRGAAAAASSSDALKAAQASALQSGADPMFVSAGATPLAMPLPFFARPPVLSGEGGGTSLPWWAEGALPVGTPAASPALARARAQNALLDTQLAHVTRVADSVASGFNAASSGVGEGAVSLLLPSLSSVDLASRASALARETLLDVVNSAEDRGASATLLSRAVEEGDRP